MLYLKLVDMDEKRERCSPFFENLNGKEGYSMPYKVGRKTKTKGWPILEHKHGKWFVIAHSDTQEKAQSSIRARHMAAGRKGK